MPTHEDTCAVRMSSEPCPYCGEHFPLLTSRQRHHRQNPDCFEQVLKGYKRAQNDKEIEKRAAAAKLRGCRNLSRDIKLVQNPLNYARAQSHRYAWLRPRCRDDFHQTLLLALVQIGIREPEQPQSLDTSALNRTLNRELYQLAYAFGYFRSKSVRGYTSLFQSLDVNPLLEHVAHNWHATWRNA